MTTSPKTPPTAGCMNQEIQSREAEILRFREGHIDKASMAAIADGIDALFDRLALAWSQLYFSPAAAFMYDTKEDEGSHVNDFLKVYFAFRRGDNGWGLFIETERAHIGGEISPRVSTPIKSASNLQKESAIDLGLHNLKLALSEAMEDKRCRMLRNYDSLAEIVCKASDDLKIEGG